MSGHVFPGRMTAVVIFALFQLTFLLPAVSAPAEALAGEETLEIHKTFVIIYNNVSGSDVIWWDWAVTGEIVKMTFWIVLSDPETTTIVDDEDQVTIHKEFTSQSSGHIHLRDGYHTATVKWSCHALHFVTFRYHVMLNPPDLTLYYSLAAAMLIAPVLVIGMFLVKERRQKAIPVPGHAGS